MKSCIKSPKTVTLRHNNNAKSLKTKPDLDFFLKILQESTKLSIEQYKTLSTMLMTINGAGVITLLNKDISKYSHAIYSFSIGILAAVILLYIGFIFSSQHIGNINKKLSSMVSSINMFKMHTRRVVTFIILSMLSFFASIIAFEYALFAAINASSM